MAKKGRIRKGSAMARKSSVAHKYRTNLRDRATKAELVFKTKLDKLHISYKFQRAFISGKGFAIVDFYLPGTKTGIEIDGGYHFTAEQEKKDAKRDRYLTDVRSIQMVRITNERAMTMSIPEVASLVGLNDPANSLEGEWPVIGVGDTVRVKRRNKLLKGVPRCRQLVVREVHDDLIVVGSGKRKRSIRKSEYMVYLKKLA